MTLEEAVAHWYALRNVPLDEHGIRTESDYEHFPKGAEIEDIWRWLEDQCQDFVAGHAYEGRYRDILTDSAPAHPAPRSPR